MQQAAATSLGHLGQASPEVISALVTALGDRNIDVRQAAHQAISKLLDGKPIPGGEWVSLREQRERRMRRKRRAALILLALVMVVMPLAYLLATLYVPWVRDNAWFLSILVANIVAWIAFLANVGKIRQTLGDLWR